MKLLTENKGYVITLSVIFRLGLWTAFFPALENCCVGMSVKKLTLKA